MAAPLDLSARRDRDGKTVLVAAGEIDMSNAARFGEALSEAGSSGADFVVDLTAVEYLDSAGLTALLPYASRVRIRVTDILGPLLAVSGLAAVTTVVPAP